MQYQSFGDRVILGTKIILESTLLYSYSHTKPIAIGLSGLNLQKTSY